MEPKAKAEMIEVDERATITSTVHGNTAREVMEKLLIAVHQMHVVDKDIVDEEPEYPLYEVQIYVDLVTSSSVRRKRSRRNPSVRLPSKIVMTVEE